MVDDDFTRRVGIDLKAFKKSSLVDIEDDYKTVHFFPAQKKGKCNNQIFLYFFSSN